MQAALHLVIAGHIDHGKSTLIGRLLHDCGALPQEKIEEVRRASEREGRPFEFAFLMDHLREERARGITIDTCQYHLEYGGERITLIDAPGHNEFLKNMLTGASQADAAVLVVDGAEGVREQTQRHVYLLKLLGITQIAIALNKMDLAGWDAARFEAVAGELKAFARRIGMSFPHIVPMSASAGEGVLTRSSCAPWYDGPALFDVMRLFTRAVSRESAPAVFPVQNCIPVSGQSVLVGTVASGRVQRGQALTIHPGAETGSIRAIKVYPEERESAEAGESIGLVFESASAPRRGNVLAAAGAQLFDMPAVHASLFWLGPGRLESTDRIVYQTLFQESPVVSVQVLERLNSSTLDTLDPAQPLEPSEVAEAVLTFRDPLVTSTFQNEPELGRFTLLRDGRPVAGGVITAMADQQVSG